MKKGWWGRQELNLRPLPETVLIEALFLRVSLCDRSRTSSFSLSESANPFVICFWSPSSSQARLRPHHGLSSTHTTHIYRNLTIIIFKSVFSEKYICLFMGFVVGLPAIGRGTHPIPYRTRQLNRAPFPTVVWSSAMRTRGSWLPY